MYVWPEFTEIPIRDLLVKQFYMPEVKCFDLLMASISEYGMCVPILVSRSLRIVSGTPHVLAALALGWTKVPVVFCRSVSPEQVRLIQALHKEQLISCEWDAVTEKFDQS